AATAVFAQEQMAPVRSQVAEKLAVSLRFRDWSPVTVAGTTVVGGNQTGTGGLYAVDAATGRLKWSLIPKLASGTASIATAPAVSGNVVIAAFRSGGVMGVALASGKELWRGPRPAQGAGVLAAGGIAYFAGEDGAIYALDAGTGQQRWRTEFQPTLAPCYSRPLVAGGNVILTGIGPAAPKDPTKRGGYYLFSFDAATGQERWRYRAEAPYIHNGVCLTQPVLADGAVYATGESRVYAVDANTGGERWAPVEIRRTQEGRMREVKISAPAAASGSIVVATPVDLIGIDPASGRVVWELPGTFDPERAHLTSAGGVLYFQGSPASRPAARPTGTLFALDLDTRSLLWSFTRPTEDPNWSFGSIAPANGGLWVDTYRTLLKLE
ncbi:MAG TPA: PQQ-binding-like beta-propeller repeat protein, partial [Bryobacteraceae bacterium]|nr:PQQ-binding-like beta-propeller repeat protein [Bryobacteraceae bacterium]